MQRLPSPDRLDLERWKDDGGNLAGRKFLPSREDVLGVQWTVEQWLARAEAAGVSLEDFYAAMCAEKGTPASGQPQRDLADYLGRALRRALGLNHAEGPGRGRGGEA